MAEQCGLTLLLDGCSSWDSLCPKAASQLGGKQASSPQPVRFSLQRRWLCLRGFVFEAWG